MASVTMDLNDVEGIDFNALGGADRITVNDLSGTDVTEIKHSQERLREERQQFRDAYERFLGRFSLDEIGLDPSELSATRDMAMGRRVAL